MTLANTRLRPAALATLSALLLATTGVHAQWVSFSDETATRLRVRPFADGTGTIATDAQEKDFAVGDLNRDGRDDMVVVRKEPFSNAGARQDLLLLNFRGRLIDLTARYAPGFLTNFTDARDVTIVDVDNDDWPDVFIANTFEEPPKLYRNLGRGEDGRWRGLADESFRLPTIDVPTDINTIQICAVAAGDVTGDGFVDFYLSNYNEVPGTRDLLLINDGTGNFNLEQSRLGDYARISFGTSAEIHDMDGDGDQDIVKLNALFDNPVFPHGVFILFNDGNGQFDTVPYQQIADTDPYMFTVYDHDLDGALDVYIVKDSRDELVTARGLIADGPIEYDTRPLPFGRTNQFGGNVKAADVDNDGDLDVGLAPIDVDIANCGDSTEFTLWENIGASGLRDNEFPDNANFSLDPHDFAFIDIDGNGCVDMVMGLCEGWRVFMNNGCVAEE
ncbi:MAG: VCBS repeat-containing protein [Pseudomonadota bacterium]